MMLTMSLHSLGCRFSAALAARRSLFKVSRSGRVPGVGDSPISCAFQFGVTTPCGADDGDTMVFEPLSDYLFCNHIRHLPHASTIKCLANGLADKDTRGLPSELLYNPGPAILVATHVGHCLARSMVRIVTICEGSGAITVR